QCRVRGCDRSRGGPGRDLCGSGLGDRATTAGQGGRRPPGCAGGECHGRGNRKGRLTMTQARLLGGRYQVGELLGYGGMAEVHRGRDLRLGRDVAIKMLRTGLARDDTFPLRFRREAQDAASLNHPAIVAVYDTGEERGATGESLPYI